MQPGQSFPCALLGGCALLSTGQPWLSSQLLHLQSQEDLELSPDRSFICCCLPHGGVEGLWGEMLWFILSLLWCRWTD